MKHLLLMNIILLSFTSFPVTALTAPPLLELGPTATKVNVPIENNSAKAVTYLVSIDEITFPDSSEITLVKNSSEIMFTPIRVTLAAHAKTRILLIRKMTWNKERYFKITLTEDRPERFMKSTRATEISYPVSLSVNLIARPRKMNFDYIINENRIRNIGNTYFVLMRDGDCGDRIGDTFIIPPEKSIAMPTLDESDVLRLGKYDRIISLKDGCHKNDGFWHQLFG